MGYLHIENLPSDQRVLRYTELVAMEKVHGTSAKVFKDGNAITYSGGGETQVRFLRCFDLSDLNVRLTACGFDRVSIHGEAYGGSQQRMADTYGDTLRFIVFDVQANGRWLDVEEADAFAQTLGLEFVPYKFVSNDVKVLEAEMRAPSEVAIRRGMGNDKVREGIVIKPRRETVDEDGDRVIAKFKADRFRETMSVRPVVDPATQARLEDAAAIAKEWVVLHRLEHVLGSIRAARPDDQKDVPFTIKDTGTVCAAMVEDVFREGKREIVDSKEARTAVSKRASLIFREYLKTEALGL